MLARRARCALSRPGAAAHLPRQGGHGGAELHVTDSKGHYINGLKPTDFRIYEDGILAKDHHLRRRQQAARAGVGGRHDAAADRRPRRRHAGARRRQPRSRSDAFVGTNVFVLFDTSNFMYRGFVYAEDAIADFVRGLDRADSVAVYTFSRNLSRAAPLTHERSDAILGPAQSRGRRRRGALQRPAADPARRRQSARPQSDHRVLQRPRQRQHGGARRRARGGRGRRHPDLRHLHQRREQGPDVEHRLQAHLARAPAARPIARRPGRSRWRRSNPSARIWATATPSPTIRQPNPNEGFRKINVEIVSDVGKKYRVRARPGYRPRGGF